MGFDATRRRLLAGLAVFGAGGLVGVARAEDSAAPQFVPCSTSQSTGTYDAPSNGYSATATNASFLVMAHIVAKGDNIVLFADQNRGGIHTDGLALIKGQVSRTGAAGKLTVGQLSFEEPLTALSQDGQYYGIVGMAHEQKAPVGFVFYVDGNTVGEWELKPGEFEPTSREIVFPAQAGQEIYDRLMGPGAFRAELTIGGVAYSVLDIKPGDFAGFITDTLLPAMDKMAEADTASPCVYDPTAAGYDALSDCFLTSACCAVIGLADRCWELETLRKFRDGWMRGFAEGRADIARYYREAPAVAQRLVASPAGRARLLRLYWTVIVPAALLIRVGANRMAYGLYRGMMLDLLRPQAA